MIEFNHIHKRFGRLNALNDVDLHLAAARRVALIGPNGSGKTTLIKCLLGMVVPDRGQILFDGRDIRGDCVYRAAIGYMPQLARYPDNMTIAQLFNMMKDIRGTAPADELAPGGAAAPFASDEDLIQAFNLRRISNKRMRTLSGGTRQKVSACLAFLFNPLVLVLDEPTAGLDPIAAEILKEKIATEAARGKLVLITSHILSELDDLVDEVVFLEEGRLRFHKSLSQLKHDTGEARLTRAIARVMQT